MKKPRKNLLDEMQEQKMLRIEHNGFWIAFIGLCVVILIQLMICPDLITIVGELAVFAVTGGYVVVAGIRTGIWSRRLGPSAKTNFLVSLVGGMVAGVFMAIFSAYYFREIWWVVWPTAMGFGITFVLCEIGLTIGTFFYKRRKRELEALADQDEA